MKKTRKEVAVAVDNDYDNDLIIRFWVLGTWLWVLYTNATSLII